MNVRWAVREPPLPAAAVAASGAIAEPLAAKAEGNPRWQVTRLPGWTVVTGDDLPWLDGVTYLGALPGTAGVLVPVHRRPCLHPDLIVRAVTHVAGRPTPHVALLPDGEGEGVAVLVLDHDQ